MASRRCAITKARFASNSWICGSRRVTRQRISHTTRGRRVARRRLGDRDEVVEHLRQDVHPARLHRAAPADRGATPSACGSPRTARTSRRPPAAAPARAGTAAVARGVGRSLSCIASSSSTSTSPNPKSGRAPGSDRSLRRAARPPQRDGRRLDGGRRDRRQRGASRPEAQRTSPLRHRLARESHARRAQRGQLRLRARAAIADARVGGQDARRAEHAGRRRADVEHDLARPVRGHPPHHVGHARTARPARRGHSR